MSAGACQAMEPPADAHQALSFLHSCMTVGVMPGPVRLSRNKPTSATPVAASVPHLVASACDRGSRVGHESIQTRDVRRGMRTLYWPLWHVVCDD